MEDARVSTHNDVILKHVISSSKCALSEHELTQNMNLSKNTYILHMYMNFQKDISLPHKLQIIE